MKRLLIQLDTDHHPSTFDRVVAIDAGADEVFAYGGVTPDAVESLVHGAMFTRRPAELKNTAVYVGGGNVAAAEQVFQRVQETFFGPMRVSAMVDPNGSNTTAAATVLAAAKHLDLSKCRAVILGGTGPVGCRAAQILLSRGAEVVLGSRSLSKAEQIREQLALTVDVSRLIPTSTGEGGSTVAICQGAQLLIASGAAGIQLLSKADRLSLPDLRVAIDLNAVPPLGIEGVEMTDKNVVHDGVACYGAIGVGGTKMKIHIAAIQKLFESNTHSLDTTAIFELGLAVFGSN